MGERWQGRLNPVLAIFNGFLGFTILISARKSCLERIISGPQYLSCARDCGMHMTRLPIPGGRLVSIPAVFRAFLLSMCSPETEHKFETDHQTLRKETDRR